MDWDLFTPKFWGRFRCSIIHNRNWKPNDMPVLGLAGRHWRKLEMQVRLADQAMYHQGNQSVFVGGRLWTLLPPPANKVENSEQSNEVLHLYRWSTHTHTMLGNQEQQISKEDTTTSGIWMQCSKSNTRRSGNVFPSPLARYLRHWQ